MLKAESSLVLDEAGISADLNSYGRSDDVGIGVPLLGPVFDEERVKMLYVLSALQAMTLNPIAFALLELGMQRRQTAEDTYESESGNADGTKRPQRPLVLRVLHGTATNPLVLSVVGGALYNGLLRNALGAQGDKAWGLFALLKLLGQAFTPVVLFLAGSSLVITI